jgi:hypothetical protein
MSKYGNKRHAASDGTVCDSKREAIRWNELLLLERIGEIGALERQVPYELIPRHDLFPLRSCSYIADFRYTDKSGKVHVEDSKGVRTREFIIKKKLMAMRFGIFVEEV